MATKEYIDEAATTVAECLERYDKDLDLVSFEEIVEKTVEVIERIDRRRN